MGVTDGLKQAAAALRAADKIPEYNAILDAQQKIFDLQNEAQELKNKNQSLEEQLNKRDKVEYKDGAIWEKLSDGGYKGPCCPARCWEADHRTIPLTKIHIGRIKWQCPCCKGQFDHGIPEKHPNDPNAFKPQATITP